MSGLIGSKQHSDSCAKPPLYALRSLVLWVLVTCIFVAGAEQGTVIAVDGFANEGQEGTDLYGDPLPACAIARMGTLRFWAGGPIGSISFAPDGKTVAATCQGYTGFVSIWEVDAGRVVHTLPSRGASLPDGFSGLGDVAYSPDGKYLAACGNETVVIWELATRRIAYSLRGQSAGISDPTFAKNGERLATSGGDQTVRVWNLMNGQEVRQFPFRDLITAFALSPDGSILAAAWRDETIKLWDVATGKVVRTLPSRGLASSITFAPDGHSMISLADDGFTTLHDIASSKVTRRIRLESWTRSHSTVLSSDGKMVAEGRKDASIIIWETTTGKQIRRIQLEPCNIAHRIAFSPDGKTIAAADGDDTVLQLWDLATGKEKQHFPTHRGGAGSVSFSPDGGMIAAADATATIALWDASTGRQIRRITDGPREIWDETMEEDDRQLLRDQIGPSGHIAFCTEGKTILSTGTDGTLRFWETRSGKLARVISLEHSGQIGCVAFSAERELIAVSSEDSDIVGLWDVKTGRLIRRVSTNTQGPTRAIALAPNGKAIATAGDDRTVRLWDTAGLRPLDRFFGPQDTVLSIAFSPDSGTICVGGIDAVLRLLRKGEGEIQRSPDLPEPGLHGVRAVAFSVDGSRVAWGGDDCSVRIWDVARGQETQNLKGHRGAISSLAFSRNSRLVASASVDGTVLIWDLSWGGKKEHH